MSVNEQLMRLGSWNLRLRDDTPMSVRNAARIGESGTAFDHVVITTAPIDTAAMSDTTILASALYTGVIVDKDEFSWSGFSPLWWLGTEDDCSARWAGLGSGHFIGTWQLLQDWTYQAVITGAANQTVADMIKDALVIQNGVTAGTITAASGTGTLTGPATGSFRTFLDFVCQTFGYEYRVNPNFTLDMNTASNLFVSTPTVVVNRREPGLSGSWRGIAGPNLSLSKSGRNISTNVQHFDAAGTGANATAGTVPLGPFNASAEFVRYVNSTDSGGGTTAATAVLNLYSATRKKITLDSDEYAIGRFAKPGDYIYLWEPDSGLYDTANQIEFRGETIFPIKLRLKSTTWGIQPGMGVYLRQTAATPVYIDLRDYIIWEDSHGDLDQNSADPGASPYSSPAPGSRPPTWTPIPGGG